MNSEIVGISHVTFICRDLNKTSNFLKQVFDAEEIYSSGNISFSIAKEKFFKIGNLWIAIMEGDPIARSYNLEMILFYGTILQFLIR